MKNVSCLNKGTFKRRLTIELAYLLGYEVVDKWLSLLKIGNIPNKFGARYPKQDTKHTPSTQKALRSRGMLGLDLKEDPKSTIYL